MTGSVPPKRSFVCVVDDDESVRESLPDLLGEFGLASCAFGSGEELFASVEIRRVDCYILDVAMPGMTGPQILEELRRLGHAAPVIFITAHAEASMIPRFIEQGAVACLLKPFHDTALLHALTVALAKE